jgi:RNA polymerase sigma-70 factor, ECF subfamily
MTTGTTGYSANFAGLHAAANLAKLASEETSDLDLIESIADGDRNAMHILYMRHYTGIYRFVYRTLRTKQAAEDTTSDVFLDVWRKADRFEQQCEVSTWLFAIARNKSIDALRRRRTDPLDEDAMLLIEDEADDPETQLHKRRTDSVVRKCLENLSPAHRAVIELVYFQGKSTLEAAKIAGVARGTVKTRLFYAREQLTQLLGAKGIVAAAA